MKELIRKISENKKYHRCVFWGPGIYFVIANGEIRTISEDASSSPRGGWFPELKKREDGELYYKWDGEYINLYDNIAECGEGIGYYDDLTENDWASLLERLDNHIVNA